MLCAQAATNLAETIDDPSFSITHMDIINAYGTVARTLVRGESEMISASHPEFQVTLPLFDSLFPTGDLQSNGVGAPLLQLKTANGIVYIPSCEGLQQGSPIGGLSFVVGMAAVMRRTYELTQAKLGADWQRSLCDMSFLDDVHLIGDFATSACFVTNFTSAADELESGLKLAVGPNKSWAWTPFLSGPRDEQLKKMRSLLPHDYSGFDMGRLLKVDSKYQCIDILGAPVGLSTQHVSIKNSALQQVGNYLPGIEALKSMTHETRNCVQTQMILLRQCVQPQANYITRTTEPALAGDALRVHDDAKMEAATFILGLDEAEAKRGGPRVTLPIRMSGLGIIRAQDTADAAYLASSGSVMQLADKLPLIQDLRRRAAIAADAVPQQMDVDGSQPTNSLTHPRPRNVKSGPGPAIEQCGARTDGATSEPPAPSTQSPTTHADRQAPEQRSNDPTSPHDGANADAAPQRMVVDSDQASGTGPATEQCGASTDGVTPKPPSPSTQPPITHLERRDTDLRHNSLGSPRDGADAEPMQVLSGQLNENASPRAQPHKSAGTHPTQVAPPRRDTTRMARNGFEAAFTVFERMQRKVCNYVSNGNTPSHTALKPAPKASQDKRVEKIKAALRLDNEVLKQSKFPTSMQELQQAASVPGNKLQARLTDISVHRIAFGNHYNSCSIVDRAQLLSQTQFGAASFMMASPSEPSLAMSDALAMFAFRGFLGVHWAEEGSTLDFMAKNCTCQRGQQQPDGHDWRPHQRLEQQRELAIQHTYNCNRGGGSQRRHDLMVAEIADCLRVPGGKQLVRTEQRAVHLDTGNGGPDITVQKLGAGATPPYWVEVSIINEGQKTIRDLAATTPGYAARLRARQKREKYARACNSNSMHLVAATVEVHGAFSPGLESLLRMHQRLEYQARKEGRLEVDPMEDRPYVSREFAQYWAQRLSITLQRGQMEMNSLIETAARQPRQRQGAAADASAGGAERGSTPARMGPPAGLAMGAVRGAVSKPRQEAAADATAGGPKRPHSTPARQGPSAGSATGAACGASPMM